MNLRTPLPLSRDTVAEARPLATVIALSQVPARRFRRDVSAEAEPKGQILLFTGVRYERMPEVQSAQTVRRRKRS